MRTRAATLVAVGLVGCLLISARGVEGQTTRPTTTEEIARLVAGLGNRSYQKREQITRRIAEIGPAAIPYLLREINNPKQEVALTARELMQELEEVLFCGVSIRLEIDPPRITWDQPARLRLVAENRSAFEAKLPWANGGATATRPASVAAQVGRMLDVGDFLEVTAPNDELVEMRVDPIGDDRDVEATVNERASGGPVSQLAPSGKCVVNVAEFNRGWARYPLLAKGRYRIRFTYQPEWSRSEWIEAGLGKVVSNDVVIEVTNAAPPAIREAKGPAKVLIERKDGRFVATMFNQWDRPFCLNLNFGSDPIDHAQLHWSVRPRKGETAIVTVPPAGNAAPAPPEAGRIRLLQSGEKIELGSIEADALRAALEKTAPNAPAEGIRVTVKYANRATREDLRRIGEKAARPADAALRTWAEKTPYPVVTGSPGSSAIFWTKSAATEPAEEE